MKKIKIVSVILGIIISLGQISICAFANEAASFENGVDKERMDGGSEIIDDS